VEYVRKNKPSPNNFPGTDWQLLDELELSVGSSMDDKIDINVWLTEILGPLELQIDFFKRVLSSAQEATARAMHIVPMTELTYIHLFIFVPAERMSNSQMWGFFRIEKIGDSSVAGTPSNPSIELYLYLADN
jgi:hypothetical protein